MKAKRALLEPKLFDKRYVLLLVDMSGPIVDSEDLPELLNSVGAFIDHVGATHEIAVGAFDGNDEVVPFLGYGGTAETKKVVEAMRKFRPRSRNTNLNGAVYQGLHSLRDRLKEAPAPKKIGDPGDLHRPRRAGAQREPRDAEAGPEGDAGRRSTSSAPARRSTARS